MRRAELVLLSLLLGSTGCLSYHVKEFADSGSASPSIMRVEVDAVTPDVFLVRVADSWPGGGRERSWYWAPEGHVAAFAPHELPGPWETIEPGAVGLRSPDLQWPGRRGARQPVAGEPPGPEQPGTVFVWQDERLELWRGGERQSEIDLEAEREARPSLWRRMAYLALPATFLADLATLPVQVVWAIVDLATYDGPWP